MIHSDECQMPSSNPNPRKVKDKEKEEEEHPQRDSAGALCPPRRRISPITQIFRKAQTSQSGRGTGIPACQSFESLFSVPLQAKPLPTL
jgi:hypothetical protein